jgi:homoserine dehydrogenase
MPTASAVVADLIDLAVGRAQQTFRTMRLWSETPDGITLRPPGTVPSRFYLRLMVEDRPGVLAEIARVLANHRISISSVIQHEGVEGPDGDDIVPLIIMTHTAPTGDFLATLAEFDRLDCVTAPSVYYPVGD